MSAESIQASIFGESASQVATIETCGRTLRPILSMVTPINNEAEAFVYADDGLQTTLVDPANVAMLDLKARPAAFDSFDVQADGSNLGVSFDQLRSRAKHARMSTRSNDRIALDVDERRSLVTVEREYDETTVRQTDEVLNFDPEDIRRTPDMPDLELDWTAYLDPRAFIDTVENLDSDHVVIREDDGHLIIASEADGDEGSEYDGLADFGAVAEAVGDDPKGGASGIYSTSYLSEIAKGLKKGKVDTLRVEWGDEFPMKFHFERFVDSDDGEKVAYEGQYMLAPRIESDG